MRHCVPRPDSTASIPSNFVAHLRRVRSASPSRRLALALALAAVGLSAPGAHAQDSAAGPPVERAAAESDEARKNQIRAYTLYLSALEAAAEGELDEAESLLNEVLTLDPRAARARSTLARLCLRKRDLVCAESEAEGAVRLTDDDADGHKVLAEIALLRFRRDGSAEQIDKAVHHLRQASAVEPLDASIRSLLIRVLSSQGRFVEAEEEARSAARTPGLDPARMWLELARSLLAQGESERASEVLAAADVQGRGAIPVLRLLADLKARDNDLPGLVEVLRELWRLSPDEPEVAQRLGVGLLDLGDPFEALVPLDAAADVLDDDPTLARDRARALVALGRGSEALVLLGGLPTNFRTPQLVLLWAQAAEQAEKFSFAASLLDQLIETLERSNPALAPAFRLRAARDRLQAGEPEEALRAIESLGDEPAAIEVRLEAYRAAGRDDEADALLARLKEMTASDPGYAALVGLETRRRDGDEAAVSALLKSARSGEGSRQTMVAIASWLIRWDEAPLAARWLDATGLSENPTPELLRLRAVTMNAAGRVGEAEAAFRRLLEASPEDDSVLNELGYLLATEGRMLDEAIVLLEKAVSLKPDEPAYLDSLAWALHRSGEHARALPLLRRAVRDASDAQVGVIREHLGDVYLAMGQPERALAEWNAALIYGSEDPGALREKIERNAAGAGAP